MLLAALLAAAVGSAAATADIVRPGLQVDMQIVDGSGLTPDDIGVVARDIERIWSPFIELAVSARDQSRRMRAIEGLRLTVTTATLPSADATGLGWIEFVDGEPEPAITVSVTAARALLAGGSWQGRPMASLPRQVARRFLQRTLARAAAHEIGHYLLRSKTHARRGLMRPVFSIDEMMDGRAALVRLSADEVARLHAGSELVARQSGGRH